MSDNIRPFVLLPTKRLTEEDQARVLDKIHRLETAVILTPDVVYYIRERVQKGNMLAKDVPVLRRLFERHGI